MPLWGSISNQCQMNTSSTIILIWLISRWGIITLYRYTWRVLLLLTNPDWNLVYITWYKVPCHSWWILMDDFVAVVWFHKFWGFNSYTSAKVIENCQEDREQCNIDFYIVIIWFSSISLFQKETTSKTTESRFVENTSHRIHGTGIFTYMNGCFFFLGGGGN